jgi:hypothetical protein
VNDNDLTGHNREWEPSLHTLLDDLADGVSHMPQREYSAPAWAQARRVRRRRAVMVAAAAAVVVAVPVAVLVPENDRTVQPGPPVYSEAPVRARAAQTATLLGDGRVLIVGGCATDGCTTAEGEPTTEYYVPGQGFTAGLPLVQPRQGHTATPLADGRVLIVGGWAREGTGALDSAEVYQPRTGRFEPVQPMSVGRGGHIEALLHDGRVLIAGGDTETAELFDPESNAFTLAASMPEPRFGALAITLTDGRVLVVGGRDSSERAMASAVVYEPATDRWQPTGSMGTPRDKHALAPLPDGRVLVLGGTPDDRELLSTTEVYDPATGAFEPGPTMDTQRYKLSAAVDAGGRVIVAGGTQAAVYDAAGFHPITATAGPVRWSPTVTILRNGDVLIIGGYDASIDVLHDAVLVSAGQIDAATQ